jgi:hypothetical protein
MIHNRDFSCVGPGSGFNFNAGDAAWSASADRALWQEVKHASDCNGGASHAAPAGRVRNRRGTKPGKAARVRNRCTLRPIAARASGGLDRNPVPVEAGAAKAVEVSRARGNERDGPDATRSAFGSKRAANGPGGFSDLDAGAILPTRSPRAACLRGPLKEGSCRRRRGPARQPSRARERPCFRSRTGTFPISLAKSPTRETPTRPRAPGKMGAPIEITRAAVSDGHARPEAARSPRPTRQHRDERGSETSLFFCAHLPGRPQRRWPQSPGQGAPERFPARESWPGAA